MASKHMKRWPTSYVIREILIKAIVRYCVCSVAKLCLTLCNPVDCHPPGSSVHGIFQARILEWVAISSSRGSSGPRDQTHVSCVSRPGRQILYYCATGEAASEIPLQHFSVQFSSVQLLIHIQLFVTPWTATHQASLSITNS